MKMNIAFRPLVLNDLKQLHTWFQKPIVYKWWASCDTITVETLSLKQNDPYYLKTYQFYEKNGFKPLFELSPYGPELLMCYMLKSINRGL